MFNALHLALLAGTGHGPDAFEWAGMFHTTDDIYTWSAQRNDAGEYADPTMDIVFLNATGETLAILEREANHAFENNCTSVSNGETLVPQEDHCYKLVFEEQSHTTFFLVDTTNVEYLAVFAQHFPIEFERDMHYFKDINGEDVEPEAELPEAEEKAVNWGSIIGACIITNIVTLVGVIFLVPLFTKAVNKGGDFALALTNAFSSGALISAAFFLLLHESTHLIKGPKESWDAGVWGSLILTGIVTAVVLDLVLVLIKKALNAEVKETKKGNEVELNDVTTTDAEKAQKEDIEPSMMTKLNRIILGITIGDFMHNFVDGIVIGTAFMLLQLCEPIA